VSDTPENELTDSGAGPRSESLFRAPPLAEQERMVEAMLFASAEPLGVAEMEARMPHGCDPAEALQLLRKRYEGRGVQVARVGEGWAIRTAADLGFSWRARWWSSGGFPARRSRRWRSSPITSR
jgi:segregation and condensation protein B